MVLALLLGGLLPLFAASNQSRYLQGRVRRLKACVGLLGTMAEPQPSAPPLNPFATSGNPADQIPDPDALHRGRTPVANPFLFYVLDQRKDLKPDGWEFYNPAAPPFATREQALRWGFAGLTQNQALRTDMAPYWEVVISQANLPRLLEMDVIYLPVSRNSGGGSPTPIPTFFTEEQRRVLTLLADAGVAIWTDWALDLPTASGILGGNDLANLNPTDRRRNPFFTNLDFAAAAGNALTPSIGHPLISGQFVFQAGQAQQIGRAYAGNPPSRDRVLELRALDMQPTSNFATVVPTSAGSPDLAAYVAAGRFGSGYVIGTAGNVGGAICGFLGNNLLRVTNQDLNQAEPEDLKFAYNLFAWSTEVTHGQDTPRHTAQSNAPIDGMIEQQNYPHLLPSGPGTPWVAYPPAGLAPGSLPANPAAPLLINGLAVSAVRWRNGGSLVSEISVFEENPTDDFDGNSFVDDPNTAITPATAQFADISVGQNYDRVMGLTLNPSDVIYGMSVGELFDLGNPQGARAFVFAAGNNGLLSLPAPRPGLPAADYWNLPGVPKIAPNVGVAYTGAPGFALLPGPIAGQRTEARVYGAGRFQGTFGPPTSGKMVSFRVDALGNFAQEWYYPPNQEANRLGAPAGPVTVAQVVDQGTGSVDTMVFTTSTSSGDLGVPMGPGAGDTTGKCEGWILASRGDVLGFPAGNPNPNANATAAGRRFVSVRWLNIPANAGVQAPQRQELMWDPNKHFEVRVMDKDRNYVLARYLPGMAGFTLLQDGTAGQVELPTPPAAFARPGQPEIWDLDRFVLLADYSPLPTPVDTGLVGQATMRPRFSPATPYVRSSAQQVLPTGIAGGVAVGRDNTIYYATGQGYMCATEWRKGRPQFRWKIRGMPGDYNPTGGLSTDVDPTSPTYLGDYAFVSTPAAGSRIVFASRNGTVYMFEPDQSIRFKLTPPAGFPSGIPWSAGLANEVVLAADHGLSIVPTSPGVMANQQPWGRVPGQFSVDPDTGSVTFHNMENFSLDLANALSPQQLLALGVDTAGRPAVPITWWFRNNLGNPALPTANAPWTAYVPLPIVAVYRPSLPTTESWFSGPVIAGDKVYLMGSSGYMHEIPLDPKAVDPRFPVAGVGLAGFNMANPLLSMRRVRNVSFGTGVNALASPALGQGVVAVNSPRGLTVYGSPSVVIADSNRVVEASGNSTALAVTDVVIKHRVDVSEFAIPTDPGFANTTIAGVVRPILTERKLLSRPAMVRKLDRRSSLTGLFNSSTIIEPDPTGGPGIKENPEWAEDSYLAADTGHNRIVEFNPAGKVVWECDQIYDPMDYLPSGEPLKLSGPMDAQRWVETETVDLGSGPETIYVIHTLIADTGNNRVVEIVDKVRYQRGYFGPDSFVVIPGQVGTNGQLFRWYHVVVWSSQTNAQGLKLRYRTAQRVYWPDATGNRILAPPIPGEPVGTVAWAVPPYLPKERYFTTTMAAVTGQTVTYGGAYAVAGYHRYFGAPSRAVIERKPTVLAGGDSIVFLRGNYKMDEVSGGAVVAVGSAMRPFDAREAYPMGTPVASDQYRYTQGVVDPNIPTVTTIHDELVAGAPASNNPVHRLNGISSVQLTVRSDGKFAPETYGNAPMTRFPYLLIADTDGVWEFRMRPGVAPVEFRLTMAFTLEDYAYCTGAGNGDPARLYSPLPVDHAPGGRRLGASSARRLPSGLILITSRIPQNDQPRGNLVANLQTHLNAGSDVFLLRAADYRTALERQAAGLPVPYDRVNVALHGWQADTWVQTIHAGNIPPAMRGAASIRWRAAEQFNPNAAPTLRTQLEAGNNPYELTGSYIPVQPTFADLVY